MCSLGDLYGAQWVHSGCTVHLIQNLTFDQDYGKRDTLFFTAGFGPLLRVTLNLPGQHAPPGVFFCHSVAILFIADVHIANFKQHQS